MNNLIIELAQLELQSLGLYKGRIDGINGILTRTAQDAWVKSNDKRWTNRRGNATVALSQAFLDELRIDVGPIDGLLGTRTNAAILQWVNMGKPHKTGGKDAPAPIQPSSGLRKNAWPRDTQGTLRSFYGAPGSNQAMCQWAYPIFYFGKRVTNDRFSCNVKVKDSLERISQAILERYGLREINRLGLDRWAGCLNVRPITNGSRLSTHAWGVAIDWDSDRNQFRWGRDRASLAHPDCVDFWKIWEAEGWLSLGRARNFDWMHVQAAI
jgi:hypothetical protein